MRAPWNVDGWGTLKGYLLSIPRRAGVWNKKISAFFPCDPFGNSSLLSINVVLVSCPAK